MSIDEISFIDISCAICWQMVAMQNHECCGLLWTDLVKQLTWFRTETGVQIALQASPFHWFKCTCANYFEIFGMDDMAISDFCSTFNKMCVACNVENFSPVTWLILLISCISVIYDLYDYRKWFSWIVRNETWCCWWWYPIRPFAFI